MEEKCEAAKVLQALQSHEVIVEDCNQITPEL
jgi:hypothetical protein